jgi:hypothetical protein
VYMTANATDRPSMLLEAVEEVGLLMQFRELTLRMRMDDGVWTGRRVRCV